MRDTVLILTNSDDDCHVVPVVQALKKMKQKFFRFNSDKIGTGELKIEYFLSNRECGFSFVSSVDELCSDAIKSVWYRRPNFFNLSISDPAQKEFAEVEISSLLNGLCLSLPNIFWLSKPWNIEKARKKTFQLGLAQSFGFKIPQSVFTNNPATVFELRRRCGDIIFKPIHQNFFSLESEKAGVVIPTTLMTEKHMDRLGLIEKTPGLFQEFIDKAYDLRVTIVGQKVFATKIYSQQNESTRVDWRNPIAMELLKYEEAELPMALQAKCLKMLRELDLNFGAFDFVADNSGEIFFLELNPNGQWQFIQYFSGACISQAIADILVLPDIEKEVTRE